MMLQGNPHGHFNTGQGLNFCPIPPDQFTLQELGTELLLEADRLGVDTSRVSDLVPVRAGVRPFPDPDDSSVPGPDVAVWGKFLSASGPDFEWNMRCSRARIERLGIRIPELPAASTSRGEH